MLATNNKIARLLEIRKALAGELVAETWHSTESLTALAAEILKSEQISELADSVDNLVNETGLFKDSMEKDMSIIQKIFDKVGKAYLKQRDKQDLLDLIQYGGYR
jgi:hypothetical protein